MKDGFGAIVASALDRVGGATKTAIVATAVMSKIAVS